MLIVAEPQRARTLVVLTENQWKFPHARKDDYGFFFYPSSHSSFALLIISSFFHFIFPFLFFLLAFFPSPASLAWYTVILQMGPYLPSLPCTHPYVFACVNCSWLSKCSVALMPQCLCTCHSFGLVEKQVGLQ